MQSPVSLPVQSVRVLTIAYPGDATPFATQLQYSAESKLLKGQKGMQGQRRHVVKVCVGQPSYPSVSESFASSMALHSHQAHVANCQSSCPASAPAWHTSSLIISRQQQHHHCMGLLGTATDLMALRSGSGAERASLPLPLSLSVSVLSWLALAGVEPPCSQQPQFKSPQLS